MASTSNGLVQVNPIPGWKVLLSGAAAGLVVDGTLFPLDTIKNRLQSESGFRASGAFSNLYRGIKPMLAGSVPNAALFFITYESIKDKLQSLEEVLGAGTKARLVSHLLAASLAEAASCAIRVPVDVIKTRSQTNTQSVGQFSSVAIVRETVAKEGLVGLYRGLSSILIRDIPFSVIQYPAWEWLKIQHELRYEKPATVLESAGYGSFAGGIAAFATTPLDVARTRIILAEKGESLASGNVTSALKAVWLDKGVRGLFSGVLPRVVWISTGAAIFLGTYEQSLLLLEGRPDN